ncbi:hypothetical protein Tco_0530741 [Tanacetum coccineum]
MVVYTCGEDAVVRTSWTNRNLGSCPFLGWVDPPMCTRAMDIILGLLRSRSQMEDLLDMTEKRADFEEHRANTQETKANMEQMRANVEHERANMEHDMANRMRTYLMLSWFVFIGYLFLHH